MVVAINNQRKTTDPSETSKTPEDSKNIVYEGIVVAKTIHRVSAL